MYKAICCCRFLFSCKGNWRAVCAAGMEEGDPEIYNSAVRRQQAVLSVIAKRQVAKPGLSFHPTTQHGVWKMSSGQVAYCENWIRYLKGRIQ